MARKSGVLTLSLWLSLVNASRVKDNSVNYTLTFSSEVVSVLAENFGGINLDWWNQGWDNWGLSGVRLLNYSDTALNQYVNQLTPQWQQTSVNQRSVLRIGGTMQDSIIYNASHWDACANFTFISANSTDSLNDYTAPEPDYVCNKWLNGSEYGCLTMSLWDDLYQFALRNHVKLVFGVNTCYGREEYGGLMDFTNMQQFLSILQQRGYSDNLYAFEFGNEKVGKHISTAAYAKDTVRFKNKILDVLWPGNNRPLLYTPDTDKTGNLTMIGDYLSQLATGFNTTDLSDKIDAFVYHIYPKCKSAVSSDYYDSMLLKSNQQAVWDLSCLSAYKQSLLNMCQLAQQYNLTHVILGETGEQSHGGMENETNTFISNFWYAYALSTVAHSSNLPIITDLFRQSLIGGYYELLSQFTDEPTPNPDYWLLYIWKRLIGTSGLHSSVSLTQEHSSLESSSNNKNVRGWVFSCANGNENDHCAMAVLINFDMVDTAYVAFDTKISQWTAYFLNSPSLTSRHLYVNGKLMEVQSNWQFPELEPTQPSSDQTIVVPPLNIVFVNITTS